jgi:hypothetical protein
MEGDKELGKARMGVEDGGKQVDLAEVCKGILLVFKSLL